MTDRFSDITATGGLGRNPITNAGRVAVNGHLDVATIRERKIKHSAGKSLYAGPVDDDAFRVLARDICVSERISWNRTKKQAPHILSVVNGGFKQGLEIWQVIESLQFEGLAGGHGARFDSRNEAPELDLALVRGGVTTIVNSGPKRIANGQRIYWSVPPPKSPYERAARGSNRMPLHTMPYDPTLDALTEDTMGSLMMRSAQAQTLATGPGSMTSTSTTAVDTDTDTEPEHRRPIQEGADNTRQAVCQIMLEALHVFLTSGLVSVNPAALRDPAIRAQNAGTYAQDERARRELLRVVAGELGCRDMHKKPGDPKITFRADPAVDRETTLAEFALDVFLAKKDEALLMPLAPGTRAVPNGDPGVIVRNQKAGMSDLLAGMNTSNQFVLRRVFGTAISPAEPGREFDILLGTYSA